MKLPVLFKKNQTFLLLLVLFFTAFFLRIYNINENLFFGPEQGIDVLAVKQIVVDHHLTLIGPKTDVSGIFHGPLYYYLGAIPFLLSNGNPVVFVGFFILLNSLAVFLMYLLGKEMFGKRTGMISAVLFTVSFGTIVYSHWLSNTPPSIYLSGMFVLFLYKFLRGSKKSLYVASIFWGLTGQAEFLNFLFYSVIILLTIILFRKRFLTLKIREIVISLLLMAITGLATYLLFDIKHQFLITQSVLKLFTAQTGFHVSISEAIREAFYFFGQQVTLFTLPFFTIPGLILLVIGVMLLLRHYKEKKISVTLILLWLFTPLLLLLCLKHTSLDQFFATTALPSLLIFAVIIDSLWRKNFLVGVGSIALLVGIQLITWFGNVLTNRNMFFQSPQPDLRLADQKKVIAEIYHRSDGQPFSFQAFTIPYWMQEGWEYLFWYYGTTSYHGKLPTQTGAKKLFVIIQHTNGSSSNNEYLNSWLKNTVSTWGVKKSEFSSGILTAQELQVQ